MLNRIWAGRAACGAGTCTAVRAVEDGALCPFSWPFPVSVLSSWLLCAAHVQSHRAFSSFFSPHFSQPGISTLPATLVLAAGWCPWRSGLSKLSAGLCPSFLGGSSQAGVGPGSALLGVDPEDLQNILTGWSKGRLRLQVRGVQEALPWAGLPWPWAPLSCYL